MDRVVDAEMKVGGVVAAADAEGHPLAVVEELEAETGKVVVGFERLLRQGLEEPLFFGGAEQGGGVNGRTSGAWAFYSGG